MPWESWPTSCRVENKEAAWRYHQLPTSQSIYYCIPASPCAILDLCLGKINSKAVTRDSPFLICLNPMCHHPSIPKVHRDWHCSDLWLSLMALTRRNDPGVQNRRQVLLISSLRDDDPLASEPQHGSEAPSKTWS